MNRTNPRHEVDRRVGVVRRSEAAIVKWQFELKGAHEELESSVDYNDKERAQQVVDEIESIQRKIAHHKLQVSKNKRILKKLGVNLEA